MQVHWDFTSYLLQADFHSADYCWKHTTALFKHPASKGKSFEELLEEAAQSKKKREANQKKEDETRRKERLYREAQRCEEERRRQARREQEARRRDWEATRRRRERERLREDPKKTFEDNTKDPVSPEFTPRHLPPSDIPGFIDYYLKLVSAGFEKDWEDTASTLSGADLSRDEEQLRNIGEMSERSSRSKKGGKPPRSNPPSSPPPSLASSEASLQPKEKTPKKTRPIEESEPEEEVPAPTAAGASQQPSKLSEDPNLPTLEELERMQNLTQDELDQLKRALEEYDLAKEHLENQRQKMELTEDEVELQRVSKLPE